MDRRKIIHRIVSNILGTEEKMSGPINTQSSSSVTAAFPAAAADVTSIQTTVTALHTNLLAWYTTWRGSEPAEPFDPEFLGVFGNIGAFKGNLDEVDPITRMVRNDYTTISMLAMAYEQAYSIAVALESDCPGLKTVAIDGLKDLVPIVRSLSETMCSVTVRELHNQDSSIPMSDADKAITATQNAWNS